MHTAAYVPLSLFRSRRAETHEFAPGVWAEVYPHEGYRAVWIADSEIASRPALADPSGWLTVGRVREIARLIGRLQREALAATEARRTAELGAQIRREAAAAGEVI